MLDASVITASSVQLSVHRKLEAFQDNRDTTDSSFTSRTNEIDDKLQKLQDKLNAIAESVTTQVLAGLQKPGGLLAKQDAKIDTLSEKLLRLFPMVEQILGLSATRPLSPMAGEDSLGKKHKLDGSTPMSGVQAS
jgi:hypothetical protein